MINPFDVALSGSVVMAGTPEGVDAMLIAQFLQTHPDQDVVHVARDEGRMAKMAECLSFFAPQAMVLELPGWDCVPYDRVSPHVDIVSKRVECLARLSSGNPGGRVVLTTVSAMMQRVPPRESMAGKSFHIGTGQRLNAAEMNTFLSRNGYSKTDTVMEQGEYAVRGGIIDLFPPGLPEPVRLDLFGDDVETIRTFDPVSQRTTGKIKELALSPVSEVTLDDASISRFRMAYREMFGNPSPQDALYESISHGVKFTGMEHWLPLFYEGLDTVFAYVHSAILVLDHQVDQAREARKALILEYFDARHALSSVGVADSGMVYHPIPPNRLYLEDEEWVRLLTMMQPVSLTPFAAHSDGVNQVDGPRDVNLVDKTVPGKQVDLQGRPGRNFADIRAQPGSNVYAALKDYLSAEIAAGRRTILAAWTEGSRDRLGHILQDHGISVNLVDNWHDACALPAAVTGFVVLGLDHGFSTPFLSLVTEQDVLGDRLARPARKKKKGALFIAEAAALSEGDLVVHVDHGIGRYEGLETLKVSGAAHDCLRVAYDGGDKLYVPVENLDVLSRYGSDQAGAQLDRLGGTAWQHRKAKLKKRILDMAEQLIAVAAQRQLRKAESLMPAEGIWDEFCARFPYVETDDQARAIEECINDLASGRPMDRLVCGDVGFGKTEVALRTAFVAALSGLQVAVVVPTTLLARQHYRTFSQRFQGLPVQVEQLSRMVTAKQATKVKSGLAEGSVDIVVGTHAVLAKSIQFKRLGLLIIDEEQHFGVAHKERLKQLKSDVHVLTLSATPIPRTLQLALTGVKELSVIATPPVDRLAVRTFVLPFDPVVIREAILRERYRGGQIFYVCPRLADIDRVAEQLEKLVPEVKLAVAHGRLTPTELEEVMTAFGDKQYDILLSTNIIESGLDMPSVNTLIIHRADMFGLGQLYQLRGRVGRGKVRGYAYFTLPTNRVLSKAAEKRLHVMQALDTLGAGFQLASHDLDIRGAGNLLGEEQSGHIREVGIELYQQMIEEAVAAAKGGETTMLDSEWSPQISIGASVLIPETYVADLSVRLSLYRRIADLSDRQELDALAAELVDRFGKLPEEVDNLLQVIAIKALSKQAGIEKVDAGPKGAVITFRNNSFANPMALVQFISRQSGAAKLRPDHKLVFIRSWDEARQRINGLQKIIGKLVELAKS